MKNKKIFLIIIVLIAPFINIVNGQNLNQGLLIRVPVFSSNIFFNSPKKIKPVVEGITQYDIDRFNNKNSSALFNGIDTQLKISNFTDPETSNLKKEYTVSFWMYIFDFDQGGTFAIFNNANNNVREGISLHATKDGLYFGVGIPYQNETPLLVKQWYHVAISYSVEGNKVEYWQYIDGKPTVSGDFSNGKVKYSGTFCFGVVTKNDEKNAVFQSKSKGAFDDIRIYDRILSDAEISNLHDIEDDTKAFEKFQESLANQIPKPLSRSTDEKSNSDLKGGNTSEGKYYGLIIGNNTYIDPSIVTLDKPIADANSLYEVLTAKYNFDRKNVVMLENGTYEQTIEELDKLAAKVKPTDNVLIFYAGHGVWESEKKLGYWLPVDAKKRNKAQWLPNSVIKDYIKSINSRHTLVIADACFSGSIFKSRAAFTEASLGINKLNEIPSRKAMTSGTLKTVPDESVFLKYLVKNLQNNEDEFLSADELFLRFRLVVTNNSSTTPLYGVVQEVGDEGGEFIFVKK